MVVYSLVIVAQRYTLAMLFTLSGVVGCHGCKSQLNGLCDSWGFVAAEGINSLQNCRCLLEEEEETSRQNWLYWYDLFLHHFCP